ncbi:hypothetical protein ACIQB5_41600 [Streptomyces sp. NPDC088560]|uniref:hypothetical protein n=1 Tax=Streptomyces sp. NPDC088560 TaxID=3365868 RepID=UPI00381081F5
MLLADVHRLLGSCLRVGNRLGQLLGDRVQFPPASRDLLQIRHPHTLPTIPGVTAR